MVRAVREILLFVAVAGLLPLALGLLWILGSYAAGMKRGHELWFLLVVLATAFFPLAGTAGLARLISAGLNRARSWPLAGALGGMLMLALMLIGLLMQQRREDLGAVLWIAGFVALGGAASILLTLANNWFDRRRTRQT